MDYMRLHCKSDDLATLKSIEYCEKMKGKTLEEICLDINKKIENFSIFEKVISEAVTDYKH